jgi:hypothetical protein
MERSTCICDYDCGGDPLAFFRCNKEQLCPACDPCQACDARQATKIVDGDKLCDECAAPAPRPTYCEHGLRVGDFCQGCEQQRLG